VSATPAIRHDLRPGDLGAIVAHHGVTYLPEYDLDSTFEAHVGAGVTAAGKRGFPGERERLWIVELGGRHAGSLALTDEGDDLGAVRWFVLDRAGAEGYRGLWLETFSDLSTAAAIYRSYGFRVVSEDHSPRWGRERFTYQRYELSLQDLAQSSSRASTGSSSRPFSVSA